jgi:hypothetical protein
LYTVKEEVNIKITEKIRKEILENYINGEPPKQIAKRYCLSYSAILQTLRKEQKLSKLYSSCPISLDRKRLTYIKFLEDYKKQFSDGKSTKNSTSKIDRKTILAL